VLCGCHDYLYHSMGAEIIQDSKALHRLCGQRGAEDSKRANKCPLILFLGFLETILNGEGVHRIMIKSPVMTYSDHSLT